MDQESKRRAVLDGNRRLKAYYRAGGGENFARAGVVAQKRDQVS